MGKDRHIRIILEPRSAEDSLELIKKLADHFPSDDIEFDLSNSETCKTELILNQGLENKGFEVADITLEKKNLTLEAETVDFDETESNSRLAKVKNWVKARTNEGIIVAIRVAIESMLK